MLYDINMHLPQIMNWIMESFKVGKVDELEASKRLASKVLDEKTVEKLNLIDVEHDKRKKELEDKLRAIDEQRAKVVKSLGENEANYWETIIGVLVRTVKSMTPLESSDER